MRLQVRPNARAISTLTVALGLCAGPFGTARASAQEALAEGTLAQEAVAVGRLSGEARAWEHESSDLEVDDRIHFGVLENGMRYAWLANPEPRERSYLRLHVDAGSLGESDTELGMAHFLEHMAFNGSANFEAGTLVEWFHEQGMSFGADLNAYTSFSETVYQLDLPESDSESLGEGLLVLRDWAERLELAEEEVQREKGVIDGEEAEGSSAGRRVFDQLLDKQYAGTLYSERLPIGEREVRDDFNAESVRAFYKAWYRPENMTLILVGDLGKLDPTELIEEYFADMEAPSGSVVPEPPIGEPKIEESFFAIFEPEIPTVSIEVERLRKGGEEPDTSAIRVRDLDLACARAMLNLRFRELSREPDAPFLSARVSSAGGLDVYKGESLAVSSEPENWKAALDAGVDELRRALKFGFQQAELDEVRAQWLRSLDEAVEREGTRSSGSYVSSLVSAAESRFVPTRAEADRALVRPVLEALTVEGCAEAFAASWEEGALQVHTAGNLKLEDVAELRNAYLQASAREIDRAAEIVAASFAYSSSEESPGVVVNEEHIEDLDLHVLEFENGVRLNIKATDFKKRQILVTARLAEGVLTLEPSDYALAWVGSQVFQLGGLGAHDVDELRRLTAGRQVRVGFGVANDAFSLGGATTAEDLLLELELLCAQLEDPGWREDGFSVLEDRLPLIFEQLEHIAAGPLVRDFLPELFHGDRRFAEFPERARIESVDMAQVRKWLAPHLANGPLELTIVGDLDPEQVKVAAARTVGKLGARRALEPLDARRKVAAPRTGLRMEREIETEDDKSFAFLVFPIADGLDSVRRRTLDFLGQVVQDRLRVKVREELGAAYSPSASADPSRVFPGIGTLSIQSNVNPDRVETFMDACLEVARSLHEDGATDEEVERLTEPVLARLRDARRQNGFWLSVLSEAQSRPASLDEVRGLDSFYAELNAEAITAAARAYLDPQRASTLVVNPIAADEGAAVAAEAGAQREADGQ